MPFHAQVPRAVPRGRAERDHLLPGLALCLAGRGLLRGWGDAPRLLPLPSRSMAACEHGGDAKSKCFGEVEQWGHTRLWVAVMGQNFGVFWVILMSFCALEMGLLAACCGCEG